jgi:hypothetical protein
LVQCLGGGELKSDAWYSGHPMVAHASACRCRLQPAVTYAHVIGVAVSSSCICCLVVRSSDE